jgi:hypothetical protein
MKPFLLIFSLLTSIFSDAQVFHVDDTSAVLIKTTNQSPAHWYIEVISDVAVDTTLRWKTTFSNIPAAWDINFDTQSTNHPIIHDGDSSDFTLLTGLDFPQKLIIGAMLNNTPGHGIVYFDIYNPLTPADVQTISFEFIVSALGINELITEGIVQLSNDVLYFENGKATSIAFFTLDGKLVAQDKNAELFNCKLLPKQQTYIVRLIQDNKTYSFKWIR